MKAEIAKIRESFDEKMAENVQLRRDVTNLKADYEKLKKKVSDDALEIDRQNATIKKWSAQANQKQEELNKAVQNIKVLSQETKDQESFIEKLQEKYNRLCVENSQIKKVQDDYIKENANLWEQNKQIKSQLNEARGIIEGLNGELQITKEHLSTLLPENENLRLALNEFKAKLDQAIEDNKKLIEDHEVIIAQNSIKLQSSLDTCKQLKDEVGKFKAENEKLKVKQS